MTYEVPVQPVSLTFGAMVAAEQQANVQRIFSEYLTFYDDYVARGVPSRDPDVSDLTCEAA